MTLLGTKLDALITYDDRLATEAHDTGIPVESPQDK
jgi:hypothetical protein